MFENRTLRRVTGHKREQIIGELIRLHNDEPYDFDVQGSVHRKYVPKHNQQDATLRSLFISVNCSTCLGSIPHPSSGA